MHLSFQFVFRWFYNVFTRENAARLSCSYVLTVPVFLVVALAVGFTGISGFYWHQRVSQAAVGFSGVRGAQAFRV